jgi:hypothetical protein
VANTPDETANAVDRETAWLQQSDAISSLLATNGGPWQVVQAYWPGNRLGTQKTGIYVTRRLLDDQHPLAQRYRPQYQFLLRLVWPVKNPNPPIAETEQRNFDAAIGQLLKRIRGPQGDKTHGGRFLSVAEVPEEQPVNVVWDDPEVTIQASKELRATVTYHADDIEFNG